MSTVAEAHAKSGVVTGGDHVAYAVRSLDVAERDALAIAGVELYPDLATLALFGDRVTARQHAKTLGFAVNDALSYDGNDVVAAIEHASEQWGWPVRVLRRRLHGTGDAWTLYERADADQLPADVRDGAFSLLLQSVANRDGDLFIGVVVAAGRMALVAVGHRLAADDDRVVRAETLPAVTDSKLLELAGRLWPEPISPGLYWASVGWAGADRLIVVDDWGVGFHPTMPWSRDFDVAAWFGEAD
jgi:hypothetical protein